MTVACGAAAQAFCGVAALLAAPQGCRPLLEKGATPCEGNVGARGESGGSREMAARSTAGCDGAGRTARSWGGARLGVSSASDGGGGGSGGGGGEDDRCPGGLVCMSTKRDEARTRSGGRAAGAAVLLVAVAAVSDGWDVCGSGGGGDGILPTSRSRVNEEVAISEGGGVGGGGGLGGGEAARGEGRGGAAVVGRTWAGAPVGDGERE